MGKGGGRGKGKGGCEACESIHAVACCLCLVLIGSPVLIAVGSTILASASKNDRSRSVDAVKNAVAVWDDGLSPNGWQQFQQLVFFVQLEPGPEAAANCSSVTAQMQVDPGRTDYYADEGGRFQGVTQMRFRADLSYSTYIACQYQATILQRLPRGTSNVSVVVLPSPGGDPTRDYDILVDLAGGSRDCPTRSDSCISYNARNCKANCEDDFKGTWNCNRGYFSCRLNSAYFTNFAVKVGYIGGSDGQYGLDAVNPGVYGAANVLPFGYVRSSTTNLSNPGLQPGPVFQLTNIVPAATGSYAPSLTSFSLVVRSSGDPWLTYMAATGGSGYFGTPKPALVASGVVLVVVGSLGALLWCVAAFYVWRLFFSRSRPTSRPSGVEGYAWDMANRYGGAYAPALGLPIQATDRNGLPTGQPLYAPPGMYGNGMPTPGQPVQGIAYPGQCPGAYGRPPPMQGFYPPYPHPGGGYPISNVSVELNHHGNGEGRMSSQPPHPPRASSVSQHRQQQPQQQQPPGQSWHHNHHPQQQQPEGQQQGPPPQEQQQQEQQQKQQKQAQLQPQPEQQQHQNLPPQQPPLLPQSRPHQQQQQQQPPVASPSPPPPPLAAPMLPPPTTSPSSPYPVVLPYPAPPHVGVAAQGRPASGPLVDHPGIGPGAPPRAARPGSSHSAAAAVPGPSSRGGPELHSSRFPRI